jgi:hypothetical protein
LQPALQPPERDVTHEQQKRRGERRQSQSQEPPGLPEKRLD